MCFSLFYPQILGWGCYDASAAVKLIWRRDLGRRGDSAPHHVQNDTMWAVLRGSLTSLADRKKKVLRFSC